MAIVYFLVTFFPREVDVLCVDDYDIIAAIEVRGVHRLVLSTEDDRQLRGQPSQYKT